MPVHSMYFRSKKQAVEGGQCFKRDWTALSISTAEATTTERGYGNFGPAGFDKTRRLAKERSRLHVDPEDNDRKKTYAEYNFFGAASERSKYRLSLWIYTGLWFVLFQVALMLHM